MNNSQQPLALFTSSDGQVRLQLKLVEQSLWLTQRQIAELFEESPKTISEHIANIYDEGELDPAATIRPLDNSKPDRCPRRRAERGAGA